MAVQNDQSVSSCFLVAITAVTFLSIIACHPTRSQKVISSGEDMWPWTELADFDVAQLKQRGLHIEPSNI